MPSLLTSIQGRITWLAGLCLIFDLKAQGHR